MSPMLLRPVLRALYAFRLLRLRDRRRASDSPVARSGDASADRVLLIGNGLSQGWDVDSHQLAPTGHLSRATAARTGRGCDVDLVGSDSMNMRSALAWIGDRDLADVDALVIAIGANDVLRLTPVEEWERGLADLLANAVPRLRAHVPVLVTGIPALGTLPAFDGVVARLTAPHRATLNAAARRLAGAHRVDFVEIDTLADSVGRPLPPADAYAEFGRRLADELAPRLVQTRPEPAVRAAQPDKLWDWSGTGTVVEAAARGGLPELKRLATVAQSLFKVELAVVSLVDGDRLYYGNNTDVMPTSVPLELSFCRYTVAAEEPMIVPDTRRDERFADNPLVELSYINFYAGYPLRATDGTVIGSFCLQGSRARPADRVSLDELRGLALQAEAELRRHEVARAPMPEGPAYTF